MFLVPHHQLAQNDVINSVKVFRGIEVNSWAVLRPDYVRSASC